MIFTQYVRSNATFKSAKESQFSFLDRSSRPEIVEVRAILERMVQAYPEGEQREIIARLQSGDDQAFHSALFEVALYHGLRKMGCQLEVHPSLTNGSSKNPDFW